MKADVSALMDDALEDPSQSSVLDSLCRDSELRRAWSEYHLIGDVLRRSPSLSSGFTGNVMARLAAEPTALAPRALQHQRRSRLLRYAMPLAASVMGVGAVAWIAQTLNSPESVQVVALNPAAPAVARTAAPAVPQPEVAVPVVEEADPAKASQVKPYLFAHQSYSPVGIQGVANYVRIVSDSREGPAR